MRKGATVTVPALVGGPQKQLGVVGALMRWQRGHSQPCAGGAHWWMTGRQIGQFATLQDAFCIENGVW